MKRLLILLLTSVALHISAQCPLTNTAFKSGETLEYKLFFNWKFVWIKAGTATMTTEKTTYKGKSAYKNHLITSTNKRLDKFFCMRDTLLSIVTDDLVPLFYRKGANEGGKYRLDEVEYTYPGNGTHLKQLRRKDNNAPTKKETSCTECVYDMMSMMMRARSFRGSDFKVGQKFQFPMADGKLIENETLIYRGIKNFTTEETKITYRCMVFSFVEYSGKKEKEVVTFYITDDDNHIPVRLDLFLKFGIAKAYLTRSTGLRNEQTAIIK